MPPASVIPCTLIVIYCNLIVIYCNFIVCVILGTLLFENALEPCALTNAATAGIIGF